MSELSNCLNEFSIHSNHFSECKLYEKYITLVGNSAILNPMNKHDKLLVIDPKLLIGSSIYSNDFNDSPITDEEDL